MTEDTIPADLLGTLGAPLGEGGQARVYSAPGLSLADVPGPLVYKRYKPGNQPPYGLRRLVAIRNRLDARERGRLDRWTVWPLRVVEDAGHVSGVVMRMIPPDYVQERVLPGTGTREHTPRETQFLLIPPARALVVGMPVVSLYHRFKICRDFAAALHTVHRLGLVLGDLNSRNALFRLAAGSSVLLIDCDAIRVMGNAAVVAQLNAPDWEPPERQLTQRSDRYKFGLFVLRCLSGGDQQSTTLDVRRADAVLDEEGRRLLGLALNADPARRPAARDWGGYFQVRLGGPALPRPVPGPRPSGSGPTAKTGWIRDPATGTWTER